MLGQEPADSELADEGLCLPGVKPKSHSLIRLGKDTNDCLKFRFRVSTHFSVVRLLELDDRGRTGLGSRSETVEVEQLTVHSCSSGATECC